jgi:outer membrane receptor protein involved in Fe transport
MTRHLAASVAAIAISVATPAYAQERTFGIDIPAQDLGSAVRAFAKATRQQVSFSGADVKGRRSSAVKGQLGADEALKQLLLGTGVTYRRAERNVIVLGTGTPQGNALAGAPNAGVEGASSEGEDAIVITGSRIRGATPTSPLIVLDRRSIDQSGYLSTGDLIRSIPQSFGGGQNVNVVGNQAPQNINSVSGASTVNLRGLGSESTLTLVDGHRLAYDGFQDSVDITLLPLSAIKRVEILTDGASSLYGADAIAGVANFVLADDFKGLELRSQAGTSTRGGGTEQIYGGTVGTSGNRGNVMLSYEHGTAKPIYGRDRRFTDVEDPTTLTPKTRRDSLFTRGSVNVSDTVSLFAEGLYTKRRVETVQSSGGVQSVGEAHVKQWGGVVGGRVGIGDSWQLNLSTTLSRSKDDSASITEIGGTPVFTFTNFYRNKLGSVDLQADGVLFRMAGGSARLAVGGGREWRSFAYDVDPAFLLPTDATRKSEYGFAQLNVPVISAANAQAGAQQLVFDVSARYSHYSDFGSSFDPKIGALYSPLPGLVIRGNWGTAYRAPNLFQTHAPSTSYLYSFPDPQSGGAPVPVLLRYAANPDLEPESSKFWTTGLVVAPTRSGFKAEVNVFSIRYKNRIATPISDIFSSLIDPASAPFVMRSPDPALVQGIVDSSASFSNFTFPFVPYDPNTVVAIVDDRYQNLSRQSASGFDVALDYNSIVWGGDLHLNLNSTYLHLKQQTAPEAPNVRISGTVFNPPSWRARAGASWTRAEWSFSGFGNFIGSSEDVDGDHIPSWFTADAQVAYVGSVGPVKRLRVALSAQNLFNNNPPRIAGTKTSAVPGLHYDSTNASAVGRFISLAVSTHF